jgi:hypothetical protein
MSDTGKISVDNLLVQVDSWIKDLEEIERLFRENKERTSNNLISTMKKIAAESDSLAVRAKAIRNLYWEKKLPVTFIGDAFGLTPHQVKKTAGKFTHGYPCKRQCGNLIFKSFQSRTELENLLKDNGEGLMNSPAYRMRVCKECADKEIADAQAKSAENARELRIRKEQLRSMSWEDYIETKEWIEIRNTLIHIVGYQCQACHMKNTTLRVYPHNNTEQSHNYFESHRNYYVLCAKCVPRFEGLINEQKVDIIKREFLDKIMDWNQENHNGIYGY